MSDIGRRSVRAYILMCSAMRLVLELKQDDHASLTTLRFFISSVGYEAIRSIGGKLWLNVSVLYLIDQLPH